MEKRFHETTSDTYRDKTIKISGKAGLPLWAFGLVIQHCERGTSLSREVLWLGVVHVHAETEVGLSHLCVLSLMLLWATNARADGAEDNAASWYFDAGVSAFVVDLPKYVPLWDADLTGGAPQGLQPPDTHGQACSHTIF